MLLRFKKAKQGMDVHVSPRVSLPWGYWVCTHPTQPRAYPGAKNLCGCQMPSRQSVHPWPPGKVLNLASFSWALCGFPILTLLPPHPLVSYLTSCFFPSLLFPPFLFRSSCPLSFPPTPFFPMNVCADVKVIMCIRHYFPVNISGQPMAAVPLYWWLCLLWF